MLGQTSEVSSSHQNREKISCTLTVDAVQPEINPMILTCGALEILVY